MKKSFAAWKNEKFVPPAGVRAATKRGLKHHEMGHSGKGLVAKTVAEARSMSRGEAQSLDKVKRMRAWFARHEVDKQSPNWNDPSPGKVAWDLWGGDAGKSWSEGIMRRVEKKG